MKCIDAIIKPSKLEDVKQRVRQVGVRAMTLSEVKDCDGTDGKLRIYRGSSYIMDCVPKVRMQIMVDEDMVRPVVDAIVASARPGEIGNGNIFIYPVAETVCIRVDERPYGATGNSHHDRARVA
ncbi:MAG: P-II family nitrogen regulator [Polyangia bacterium]|jgi:nitrogen regulatory protein PII